MTAVEKKNRSRAVSRRALAVATLVLAGVLSPAVARPSADVVTELAAVRDEIASLKAEYEVRFARLQERLTALEASAGAAAAGRPATDDDLANLRAAAREAASIRPGATAATDPGLPTAPAVGRERNLNRLNPEVSFTGIFLGLSSDTAREEFRTAEFELDLQSALDPFSRTRWTLAFREGEVEIEEGWVLYNALGGGLELTAGRFRQRFGALNRQHLHALPQTEYPLALQIFFGEEGLAQTGLSLSWLSKKPWASANEITLEVTDGENEEAFGGENFEDLAVLARVKNFWDLSDATYLEWGLSGVAGETADGGDSRVWGSDLTWHWQPPRRAKYREITWRTELLRADREDETGVRREAWGGYTYVEALVRRNLYLGARYDRVEDPLEPGRYRWGISPYLTWWQSEFVRLRAEYRLFEDSLSGDSEDAFTLQLTWAAGPHKHETY